MRSRSIIAACLIAGVFAGCRGGTNVTHTGNFKNKEGAGATDLHVIFDVEGVEVAEGVRGGFTDSETDGDNKKQINLSGGNVPGGLTEGVAREKFKRGASDFNVVEWYWTTVDPETKKHKKLGDSKQGPPKNDDGSSAWN